MTRFRNILLSTDFSEAAEKAFALATSLAQEDGARLHLVHVVDEPLLAEMTYEIFDHDGLVCPNPNHDDLVRDREKRLEEVSQRLPVDPTSRFHLRKGAPAQEILKCAKEVSADLIVMATHGRTGLPHLFLGSVTERVVRESSCPVLTVPVLKHEVGSVAPTK